MADNPEVIRRQMDETKAHLAEKLEALESQVTTTVQSATDPTVGYTNVSPNIILPGSGDVTTNYLDAGAGTNGAGRFYRIRLVP